MVVAFSLLSGLGIVIVADAVWQHCIGGLFHYFCDIMVLRHVDGHFYLLTKYAPLPNGRRLGLLIIAALFLRQSTIILVINIHANPLIALFLAVWYTKPIQMLRLFQNCHIDQFLGYKIAQVHLFGKKMKLKCL